MSNIFSFIAWKSLILKNISLWDKRHAALKKIMNIPEKKQWPPYGSHLVH